jgi:hypothetical protein
MIAQFEVNDAALIGWHGFQNLTLSSLHSLIRHLSTKLA